MAEVEKDRPLLLSRRVTEYAQDAEGNSIPAASALYLESESWPPRHEFGFDWLLDASADNHAAVKDNAITLTLANAKAVYQIVPSVEVDGETRVGHSSYWAELVEGSVD